MAAQTMETVQASSLQTSPKHMTCSMNAGSHLSPSIHSRGPQASLPCCIPRPAILHLEKKTWAQELWGRRPLWCQLTRWTRGCWRHQPVAMVPLGQHPVMICPADQGCALRPSWLPLQACLCPPPANYRRSLFVHVLMLQSGIQGR